MCKVLRIAVATATVGITALRSLFRRKREMVLQWARGSWDLGSALF